MTGGQREISLKGLHIALAMPVNNDVPVGTVTSIMDLTAACAHHGVRLSRVFVVGQSIIDKARNQVTSLCLDVDADVILWVDSDMTWKAQEALGMIAKLVVEPSIDIVGAAGRKKRPDLTPDFCARWMTDDDGRTVMHPGLGLIEAEKLGGAFLAMRTSALRAVWNLAESEGRMFRMSPNEGAHDMCAQVWRTELRDGELWGEDYSFCVDARRAGLQVWLDPNVTLGHIGQYTWEGKVADHLRVDTGEEG